jgi:sugar phosphate isomerase/epimerase
MQLGIFAKTFAAQGAAPVLNAVRSAGYQSAQFNMACVGLPSMPEEISGSVISEIVAATASTGVSIAAISGTYNMAHPDPSVRADGLRRLRVIIENAKAMGTNLVTLCTGTRHAEDQWQFHKDNSTQEAWRDMRTEMANALQMAEAHDVDLGIEPELANIVSSAKLAKQLIDDLKSPHLKIVLDPANLFEIETKSHCREIIAGAVDLLAGNIVMVHAKDRNPLGEFVAAGTGVVDFEHFINCLKQAGFDGSLVTHGLNETEAPSVAAFLRMQLAK